MNWTQKDWLNLVLMFLGACIGVAVFGFVVAPALGVQFGAGQTSSYVMASVAGTLVGYALRFMVGRIKTSKT